MSTDVPTGLVAAHDKMRRAGVSADAIAVFSHYYRQLVDGVTGHIPEADLTPLSELPRLVDADVDDAAAAAALRETVVIKLNGGLGTSMGMDRAKSLLPVRGERTFLDVIAGQIGAARQTSDASLPLVLMNSFRTRDDSLAALDRHPDLAVPGVPRDFLQNAEPKLISADLTPVEWPAEPDLEWCPPGHGDLYTAIRSTGVLQAVLDAGYRYAFVSNADNLGAVPDARIAGWFAMRGSAFMLESCRRTESDRKGGHLAVRSADHQLVLRESAQTLPDDADAFADTERHRFFNTNNVWLDLHRVAERLDATGGVLGLPMIRNVKTVDPTRPDSPEVVQIETAMGAAVELFADAVALEVQRERFLPVKTTNDLVVLRSDAYRVDDDWGLRLDRPPPAPVVDLDPAYFKTVADFDVRFPHGPPSLKECSRLAVRGDVRFGRGVTVRGAVEIAADVPDGAVVG